MAVQLVQIDDLGALQHSQVHSLVRCVEEVGEKWSEQISKDVVDRGLCLRADLGEDVAQTVGDPSAFYCVIALEYSEDPMSCRLAHVGTTSKLTHADAGLSVSPECGQEAQRLVDSSSIVSW